MVEKTPEQIYLETGKIEEKPVEQAPVEETPVEAPVEKPEEKPEIKTEEPTEFEKLTGRFKSKEELDSFFEEHEAVKRKASEIEEQLGLTKKAMEKMQSENPYADNEELFKIAQLSKQLGTKDYSILGRMVVGLDEEPDLEVLKLKMMLDNPDIKAGAVLDRRLKKKYVPEKPEDYDDLEPSERRKYDEAVEDAQFELALDAKKARKEITEIVGKIQLPNTPKPEDIKAGREALVKEWSGGFKELADGFKTIKVSVPTGKDRKEIAIDIEVPDDKVKQQVMTEIAQYIVENSVKPDKKDHIRQMMELRYKQLQDKYLFGEVAKKAREMTDEQWRSTVINPEVSKPNRPQPEKTRTDEEEYLEKMKNQ
jgi:hypothetical protein